MLLGAALAVACTDDGDSGPISGEPVPEDDAPEVVPATACDAFIECGCADYVDSPFEDEDACLDAVEAGLRAGLDEGDDAGLTYDAQCVGDVLAAFGEIGCKSLTEIATDADALERLDLRCKFFYGDDVAGAPCTDLMGTSGDSCQRGLECIANVCRVNAAIAEGQPCMQGDSCVNGTVCTSLEINGASTCTSLPEVGQTCLGELDLCDLDGYCDQASKTCALLPAAGSPCSPNMSVLGRRCDDDATCENEMCIAAPAAGEPCTGVCQSGSSCVANVCQIERPFACAIGLFGA
ncbi:MAG TPA: hypothetical protein VG755_15685 [Nannocystaceae bacterium]|nr:hypothetical protein [Nannocystaceae bacterium]